MIIKAIIQKLPEQDDNHYTIRIPFFEDHTKIKNEFKALLSHTPGIYDSYKVGDVVFISFENEKLDIPIILGKLYIPWEEECIGSANFSILNTNNNLEITNNISTTTNNFSTNDNLSYLIIEEW